MPMEGQELGQIILASFASSGSSGFSEIPVDCSFACYLKKTRNSGRPNRCRIARISIVLTAPMANMECKKNLRDIRCGLIPVDIGLSGKVPFPAPGKNAAGVSEDPPD